MSELQLRFRDGDQADLPIGHGVHALGRSPTGLGPVEGEDSWLLRICNDRRGIWMTVADGLRGVHVNGRPVQQLAMLRAGDSIHVDGGELLLVGAPAARTPPAPERDRDSVGNLRLALRGIGGSFHGRSLSLESARRIGSAAGADIRIDGDRIAGEHAVIEACNGQAVLREAAADVLVNGQPVRQAALRNGDQIAFDVQHRFVVEAPPVAAMPLPGARAPFADDADLPPAPGRRHWSQRLPWLLISALLLAAALTALLLFGAR